VVAVGWVIKEKRGLLEIMKLHILKVYRRGE
jgi:hypothetical protein